MSEKIKSENQICPCCGKKEGRKVCINPYAFICYSCGKKWLKIPWETAEEKERRMLKNNAIGGLSLIDSTGGELTVS
jgi:hypothetical protein